MLEGPFVFVDIDTQRDFLDPVGALFVPGSQDILPNLERLTQYALSHQIPILATACSHSDDDPELNVFPPHCMAGSNGQKRVRETSSPNPIILDLDDRLTGPLPRHLILNKREFDVFSRPDTTELVALYNQTAPVFAVYGVATDYCVRAAIEGLLSRNCRVALITDAIRAIDADKEAELMTEWAHQGVILTMTDRVCRTNW